MVSWGVLVRSFISRKGYCWTVRVSCPILLLLVRVKLKVVFTLWLMSKGHRAVVGATYGLLMRANDFRKRRKDGKTEIETDTDRVLGFPCAPPALFAVLKVKCSWKQGGGRRTEKP